MLFSARGVAGCVENKMKKKWEISRRQFLRGTGVAIGLPVLEAMLPSIARAHSCATTIPKRLLYCFNPNGTVMDKFTPMSSGPNWAPNIVTQPLVDAGVVQDVSVLSNIVNSPAGGGHQVCSGAALTASRPQMGSAITVSDSVDQVYAKACPSLPFRSLQLGLRASSLSGTSQGYHNSYSTTQSFSNQTPLPVQIKHQQIFEKLFGFQSSGSESSFERRKRYQLSVLDFAADDLAVLQQRLGSCDQQRLDEYLTGLRELEIRIQATSFDGGQCDPGTAPPSVSNHQNHEEAVRMMHDIIVKAFECDLTRTISFMRWGVGASDGSLNYGHVTNIVTGQPAPIAVRVADPEPVVLADAAPGARRRLGARGGARDVAHGHDRRVLLLRPARQQGLGCGQTRERQRGDGDDRRIGTLDLRKSTATALAIQRPHKYLGLKAGETLVFRDSAT